MDIVTIRKRVEVGDYLVGSHAVLHALKEGFAREHMVEAVLHGTIIEEYPDVSRVLVCGKGLGKIKSSHLASSFRRSSADPGSQNPQRSRATPPGLLPRIDQISPKSEHDLGTI